MVPQDTNATASPPPAPPAGPAAMMPMQNAMAIQMRPPRSPFLTMGNLMLLAMFGIGIAGLYALRLRNGPASVLAEQNLEHAKVEAALNVMPAPGDAGAAGRSNAVAIVGEFYTAAKQRQIDPRQLRSNPFVFEKIVKPEPKPEPVEVKPKDEVPVDVRNALEVVKTLRLQSVLSGNGTTAAMISNNVVSTGQAIRGWTVVRISPREVELAWRDKKYLLELP